MDQVGCALTMSSRLQLNHDLLFPLSTFQQDYSSHSSNHHHHPPALSLPQSTQQHYRTSSASGSEYTVSIGQSSSAGISPLSAASHSATSHGSFPSTPNLSPFPYSNSAGLGQLQVPHSAQPHSNGLHSPQLYTPPPSGPTYAAYKPLPPSAYGNGRNGADEASVPLRRHEQSRYPLVPSSIGIPPIATLPGSTADEHSAATSPGSGSEFNHSPRFSAPMETKPVIDDQAGDCTAFISKLYHLLSRPEYSRFLRWNEAGDAFILMNSAEFAQFVLPRFFRHSNVSSFVRQINLYGFQRVSTICILEFADINAGDPTQGTDAVQASGFTHPFFRRGQRQLLKNLKPRSARRSKKAAAAAAAAVAGGGQAKGDGDGAGQQEPKGKGKGRGGAAAAAPPPAAH